MSAIAPIVLADGQSTPVNHTFSPAGKDANGVTKFEDRSGGVSAGYPTVSLSIRRAGKNSKMNRVTAKIVLPTLETLGTSSGSGYVPAPSKAFEDSVVVTFMSHERSVRATRKDLWAFLSALVAGGVFSSMVLDHEDLY